MKRFFATLMTATLLFTACGNSGPAMPDNFTYEGGTAETLTHNYSLQYPSEYELRESISNFGETISFETEGEVRFQIASKMIGLEELIPVYLGQEPSDSIMVDGMKAQIYTFEDGMCNEEGQCSPPAVLVRFMKGEVPPMQQMLFVVYGQSELSEPYITILESLSTTEKTTEAEEATEEETEESVDEA